MWRPYQPSDLADVERLHKQMEARIKMKFDLPPLDARPMLNGVVYEQDGEITHVAALEAEAEILLLGEQALPLSEWDKVQPFLADVIERYQLRMVRGFIPQVALERKKRARLTPIEKILKHFGFVREDHSKMTTFTRLVGREMTGKDS